MELWGGHECTVNRVGDRFRDQTYLTGHQDRIDDLARFAALGISKLRYPVLWERIAPDRPDARDWRWTDERLAEITRLGMEPIVGLLHHGSGPAYTSLIADDFAALFEAHAAAAAARYPHVADWTPINEPLTTARFSALYGHWYPHLRDERLFWKALLNQIDATRLAMRAIRRINPAARLIQTEDLGQYHSTASLASVAEHFNHRRWVTWDLLTGRLSPDQALWSYIEWFGFGDRLRAILDDPCPPDIIGINFYPTSERFLDDRAGVHAEPLPQVGYHDLTAARIMHPPPPGLAEVMRQAWARYRLPLAVTECHLGCTREEQLRWLWQTWQSCGALAGEGCDVRAVTAWALLGNVDWNSLITADRGHYEPGAFDIRGASPRPTAITQLLTALGSPADQVVSEFPMLAGEGWWQRDIRLEHAPFDWCEPPAGSPVTTARPILVKGGSGEVAATFAGECALRGLPFLPAHDAGSVIAALEEHHPWGVIEADGDDGTSVLAEACTSRGIRHAILVTPGGSGSEVLPLQLHPQTLILLSSTTAPALDVVRTCLDLVIDRQTGLWRFADGSAASVSQGERSLDPSVRRSGKGFKARELRALADEPL